MNEELMLGFLNRILWKHFTRSKKITAWIISFISNEEITKKTRKHAITP